MIKEYKMANKTASQKRLKMMRHLPVFMFLMVSNILRLPSAQAVEGYGQLNSSIRISLTIIKMPCDIKGSGPGGIIDVSFGDDVMTTRIDGVYKSRPISYTFNCKGKVESNQMQMQIIGDGASFDSEVLKTEQADLGILLMSNGSKMPINKWLGFNYTNLPVLTAAPVKAAGAVLNGGAFSSTATMKIEYQ